MLCRARLTGIRIYGHLRFGHFDAGRAAGGAQASYTKEEAAKLEAEAEHEGRKEIRRLRRPARGAEGWRGSAGAAGNVAALQTRDGSILVRPYTVVDGQKRRRW